MWQSKFRSLFGRPPEVSFNKLPNVYKNRKKILEILKNNSTPLFLVDNKILGNRLKDLIAAPKTNWGNFKIAYSFKTNYEIAKLNLLKKNGLWAEVVSGREYQMAKKLGYKGSEIIFNGPLKTDDDLKTALGEGALIFIDNFEELRRIKTIAKSQKKKFQIGIRIRSKILTLNQSRFGFLVENGEATRAAKFIEQDPLLNLVGLHTHIGTDVDSPASYKKAAKDMANLIKAEIPNYENKIKYLDFGGGFPASGLPPYGKKNWKPRSLNTYVEVVAGELKNVFKSKNPTLVLEPGRYLVDDAVLFITNITDYKDSLPGQILTTDATITMLPLIHYRPQVVKLYDKNLFEKQSLFVDSIVYGASCREEDVLYKNRLPKAETGNLLIYYITGAYNQNMASEFIFKKPNFYTLD